MTDQLTLAPALHLTPTASGSAQTASGGQAAGYTGTTPTASRQIEVWAYGSYDGTSHSGGATDSDANLTPQEKTLLFLLTIIPTSSTSNQAYTWGPFSLAQAFGGSLPRKTGIYIVHNTGAALNSTAGNHEVKRTPIKYSSA